MIFALFRYLRRRIVWCLILVVTVLLLKQSYPAMGEQIGQWITGLKDSRICRAISDAFITLGDGGGLREAAEVFYDSVQITD